LDTAAIPDLLKRAVEGHQIKISLHAAGEALAEEITRPEIEAAMLSAELLEDYPDWWLGPSCLVHGQTDTGRDLHIVVSYSGYPSRSSRYTSRIRRNGSRPLEFEVPSFHSGQALTRKRKHSISHTPLPQINLDIN
jgi:hypothetical protein